MNIVLVDDERDVHDYLGWFLQAEGFNIHSAYSGLTGLECIQQNEPDLAIIDVKMPQLDGWELCERVRTFSDVPILMISAAAQEDSDIIRGLNTGADDYLTKPLNLGVLKARINALLRRSHGMPQRDSKHIYMDPRLIIDFSIGAVHVDGKRVSLTSLEYRLLKLLVRRANAVVYTSEIIDALWPERDYDDSARYVRIYIKRLRAIIEPDPSEPQVIVTEHGLGYTFITY